MEKSSLNSATVVEIFWKQKFKEKWIKEGDYNTKYFYATIIYRRKINTMGNSWFSIQFYNGLLETTLSSMSHIPLNLFNQMLQGDIEGPFYN